jgi:hypothetical protein
MTALARPVVGSQRPRPESGRQPLRRCAGGLAFQGADAADWVHLLSLVGMRRDLSRDRPAPHVEVPTRRPVGGGPAIGRYSSMATSPGP